jgi:hypothetical protein
MNEISNRINGSNTDQIKEGKLRNCLPPLNGCSLKIIH